MPEISEILGDGKEEDTIEPLPEVGGAGDTVGPAGDRDDAAKILLAALLGDDQHDHDHHEGHGHHDGDDRDDYELHQILQQQRLTDDEDDIDEV